ncbi:MAG: hypothetical protein ABIG11_04385 [bacterium]
MDTDNDSDDKGLPSVSAGARLGASGKRTGSFLGRLPDMRSASSSLSGLLARLRKMSGRDLAMVGAGITVLLMAPLAEHFMMKPSSENAALSPGFGSRGDSAAGGVYEPGTGSFAPGETPGGEIITPLSVRDPASLIIAPGGTAMKPPAAAGTSAQQSGGLRDSMRESAKNAFSQANSTVGVPKPRKRMQSALRGLSMLGGGGGGGSSGSLSGGKMLREAAKASSKSASKSSAGPVAATDYKGAATFAPTSSDSDAFERLKSKSAKAASRMNESNAVRALDRAAAESVTPGDAEGGMGIDVGGGGGKNKSSGNSIKDSKSISGESLEIMAARMRMQKALEWEFFKKYDIWKQIANGAIQAVPLAAMQYFSKKTFNDRPPKPEYCWQPSVCRGNSECQAKYPNVIPADLCKTYGAVKNKTSTAGKEKGEFAEHDCVCGEANVPTYGTEYKAEKIDPASPEADSSHESVEQALGAVEDYAQRAAANLRALNPNSAQLTNDMKTGVVKNLQEAVRLSRKFMSKLRPLATASNAWPGHIQTGGEGLLESVNPVFQELLNSHAQVAKAVIKVGIPAEAFEKVVEGCNEENMVQKANSSFPGNSNAKALVFARCQADIGDFLVKRADAMATETRKVSAYLKTGVSQVARALQHDDRTLETASTVISDANMEMDAWLGMLATSKSMEEHQNARANLGIILDRLVYGPADGSSVRNRIKDVMGVRPDDEKRENEWWKKNSPFFSKAAPINEGTSLIRMDIRMSHMGEGTKGYMRMIGNNRAGITRAGEFAKQSAKTAKALMGRSEAPDMAELPGDFP